MLGLCLSFKLEMIVNVLCRRYACTRKRYKIIVGSVTDRRECLLYCKYSGNNKISIEVRDGTIKSDSDISGYAPLY